MWVLGGEKKKTFYMITTSLLPRFTRRLVASSPEIDGLDEATRAEFAKWWALYISAWNPEPRHGAHRMGEIAAIALPVDGQENRGSHLSGILNRVQRHQCSEAYCLRKDKDTDWQCLLPVSLPWLLRDEPDLAKPGFSKFYRLHPCRNYPNLNCYNRLMSMAWLANTDVNPRRLCSAYFRRLIPTTRSFLQSPNS